MSLLEQANASQHLHIQNLPLAIIAAGWTGDVRWNLAATLGAAFEDRRTPAGCATAHFLAAFGLAALWNGHGIALVLGLILEVLECVER